MKLALALSLSIPIVMMIDKPIDVYASGQIWNYGYTSGYQVFTAPYSGDYQLETWGAEGGGSQTSSYGIGSGGKGGYTKGKVSLTAGQNIYVYIGGKGGDSSSSSGGGGGATDLRINGTSLYDRIIVAGGGGGAGGNDGQGFGKGGFGGGINGGNGSPIQSDFGYGGTQTNGGSATRLGGVGSFGQGGQDPQYPLSYNQGWNGGGSGNDEEGGGGGGGYYGGGTPYSGSYGGGGGGGSSYIGRVQDGVTIGGNVTFLAPSGGYELGHAGNGYARITSLNSPPIVTVSSPSANQQVNPGESLNLAGVIRDNDNRGTMYVKYAIDNNTPVTIATLTGTSYNQNFQSNVPIPTNLSFGSHRLYVWGEDSEGGIGVKQAIAFNVNDVIKPTLSLTKNTSTWTSQVTITATASDNETGIKRIQLPNGNWVNGITTSYSVGENGTYSFIAEDQVGNQTTQTISITNIDKKAPTATHVIEHIDGDSYIVTVTAVDDVAGVKQIKLPNGSNSVGNVASYNVTKGESYTFELEDNAGNKAPYSMKVDVPQLNVYQKDNHVKAEWAVEMLDQDVMIKTSFEENDKMMPSFPSKQTIHYQEGASYIEVNDARNISTRRYAIGWEDREFFDLDKGLKTITPIVGQKYSYYYVLKDGRYRLEHTVYTNGVQSIDSGMSYEGNKSMKVGRTTPNMGNYFFFPTLSTTMSYSQFPTIYDIQNGLDLSLSFRAKTDDNATINPVLHGGMSSWTYPFHVNYGFKNPITISKPAIKGDSRIYVNGIEQLNQNGVYYVTNRASHSEKIEHFYMRILTINKAEGYIEIQGNLTEGWDVGYVLQSHTNRTPVNFNSRTIQSSDGWILFNVNAKVQSYEDYNSALLGLIFWFRTISDGNTYIDDVKFGYATKSQLYRGDKMLYEGYLSDYEDKEATDKAKPNKISVINVVSKDKNVFMNIGKPEDNGTEYNYTVKAVSNKGDSVSSENKKATVLTGLDGYSYVIDKNESTVPDNKIDTRTENVQIPVVDNGKYYIHIVAIDKAGNVSEVSHLSYQDNIAPTMVLTQNPTGWTNSSVQITAEAIDVGMGMKRIKHPDGTWIEGDTATYTVTQNGTYTFVAEDLVGNQATKSITISNIDKSPPTAPVIINGQDWTKNRPVEVAITAGADSQSGVKHVEYKLEGATVKGWTTYSGRISISNEGETRVLARTVDNMDNISSEVTSFVRIDISTPYNNGITIQLKP